MIAENQGKCDRFKVVLPYAGQTITCRYIVIKMLLLRTGVSMDYHSIVLLI